MTSTGMVDSVAFDSGYARDIGDAAVSGSSGPPAWLQALSDAGVGQAPVSPGAAAPGARTGRILLAQVEVPPEEGPAEMRLNASLSARTPPASSSARPRRRPIRRCSGALMNRRSVSSPRLIRGARMRVTTSPRRTGHHQVAISSGFAATSPMRGSPRRLV